MNPLPPSNRMPLYGAFLTLAGIQSAAAVVQLLRVPADPKNAVLLGLSLERLALLAGPGLLALACLAAAAAAWRRSGWFVRVEPRLTAALISRRLWGKLVLAALPVVLAAAVFLLVEASGSLFVLAPRGGLPELEQNAYFVDLAFFEIELYLPRLRPLVVLAAGLSLQTILLLPALVFGPAGFFKRLRTWGVLPVLAAAGLSALLLSACLAGLARSGPDVIGWNTIGGPLLETQVLTAAGMGVLALILAQLAGRRALAAGLPARAETVLFLLIWLAAALHWTGIPLQPSWYLAGPQAPNFEFTPTSDALVYDTTAQSMLVGEGLSSRPFEEIVVRRPLYTFFLGLLHTVAGQDYVRVAALQCILLALFPAVVYLVGRDLHSRLAGLLAAGLVILREGNTIALADEITVAHSKLLMSDLPTALGVAVLVWLLLPWVSNVLRAHRTGLAAGGMLGALMLIRIETALIYPIALAFALPAARARIKALLPGSLWFAAGIMLALLPWLGQNFIRTGEIFIETPGNRMEFLIDRLFDGGGLAPPPARVAALRLPQDSADGRGSIVARHFLHSNLQNVLILPTVIRPLDAAFGYWHHDNADRFQENCCGGEDYIKRQPFWQWQKWDLSLPPETAVPVTLNLFVLAAGLVFAVRTRGLTGLLPLAVGEGHLLINAIARTSGGRYLLPVDWIWIGYYAAGLATLMFWAFRLVSVAPLPAWLSGPPIALPAVQAPERRVLLKTAAVILLLGSVLPAGQHLYPKIYPDSPSAAWLDRALALSGAEAAAGRILARQAGYVLSGRAMYTRYFGPGEGEPGSTFPSLYPQPYERLAFMLAGPVNTGVVLAVDDLPDVRLRSGEDVLVIGCRMINPKRPYLEAALVYFPERDLVLVRSGLEDDAACPLPLLP